MNGHRVVSSRPPYIAISVAFRGHRAGIELEALIDTGFDGEVLLPPVLVPIGAASLKESRWRLADGSRIVVPSYTADLSIGSMTLPNVVVIALGDEPLIGRGVTQHFTVTFDHDRRVIVEP